MPKEEGSVLTGSRNGNLGAGAGVAQFKEDELRGDDAPVGPLYACDYEIAFHLRPAKLLSSARCP